MAIKRKAKAEVEEEVKEAPKTRGRKPAPKEEVKESKEVENAMPYGINELSEAVVDDPRNVRRWLRSQGIARDGKRYGWEKEDFDQLVSDYASRPTRGSKAEAEVSPPPPPEPVKKTTRVRRKAAA